MINKIVKKKKMSISIFTYIFLINPKLRFTREKVVQVLSFLVFQVSLLTTCGGKKVVKLGGSIRVE